MRLPVALSIASAVLAAQAVDLTKPPATGPLPAFKLPPIDEAKLPNGLTVELVEDRRFPLVTIRLIFLEAGSKTDPPELPGLAAAAAALLKEGTRSRSSRQIAEELADIGGSLEGSADRDALTISGSALSDHAARLLDLVADVARNATFPSPEIRLYQQNQKQRLAARRAQAEFQAEYHLSALLFGDHPYSRISPTPESIDLLDAEKLTGFRDAYLIPNRAVLIVLGRLPARAAWKKQIEQRLGGWERKPAPSRTAPKPPAPRRRIVLVNRPGSVQVDIRVAKLAPTYRDPEHFPLLVANAVLGTGTSSRLFLRIREEKGYAYQASSFVTRFREAAYFSVVTQVRNEVVAPALEAVLAELEKISREPVGERELTAVKNFLNGVFVIRLESQSGLADQLATLKIVGEGNDYLEMYAARVREVGPDQVQKAAAKYISPENAAVVVVGDASRIGDAVRKFGEVELAAAQ